MRALLEALLCAAERGAQIARVARQHCALIKVQEKSEEDANPRFKQDFKTLADVFIQETIRHELENKFPSLKDHILGEENNTFCNGEGEEVLVQLEETERATARRLAILVGDSCGQDLARAAHAPVLGPDLSALPENCPELDMNNIGIWIDPIDGTAEFIDGNWGRGPDGEATEYYGRPIRGLACVTVLIGAFLRDTGVPIIGVINEPFFRKSTTHCIWGVCHGDVRCCSLGAPAEPNNKILVSGTSTSILVYRLVLGGFATTHLPGAGMKLSMVANGKSDAYVLVSDTTYRWDTCGPHAILRSLGGDIVTYSPPHLPLLYNSEANNQQEEGSKRFANLGGIIAYRNPDTFENVKMALFGELINRPAPNNVSAE